MLERSTSSADGFERVVKESSVEVDAMGSSGLCGPWA
jgi:hypothetical protein